MVNVNEDLRDDCARPTRPDGRREGTPGEVAGRSAGRPCPGSHKPSPAGLLRLMALLAGTTLLSAGLAGQELAADYQFKGDLASPETDAPPLAFLGDSHFTNEVVDGLPRNVVYYPAGSGLTLANADAVLSNSYSLVVLFRFSSGGGWRRLVDFKNGAADLGLYLFYDNLSFVNLAAGAGGSVPANSYLQAALTRSAAGEVTGYLNGNREFSFSDTAGDALLSGDRVLNFFRDDLQYPNESAVGAVARLRIYRGVLSPAQVAGLDRLPDVASSARPVLTSASTAQVAVSIPFRFQLTAANDPDSFCATGLPDWAALDHLTGELSGTPPTLGTYVIGVSANNAAGSDARLLTLSVADFTLAAAPAPEGLVLTIEGQAGHRYVIEYAEALPRSAPWQELTNFVAASIRSTVTDPASKSAPQRFYHAVRLQ
jgi:hypothetical protein